MKRLLTLSCLLLLFGVGQARATCTVPFTFVNGTVADGGQVSSNFTSVLGCLNTFGSAGLTISGGDLILDGSNSGAVTIHPQANAGLWNLNLPVTAGSSGQALLSGGGGLAPMTWGTLGVAGGGTGLTSGVSGGVLAFTGTTTLTSSALLTQHALMLGGGAGAVPYTLGSLGTGTTVLHGNATGDPAFSLITNADLTNASLTIGTTNIALGATSLTLAGLTSVNKVAITAPATSATLTIADGKTLTDTSAIGTKLLLGDTGGAFVGYAGATCTNQAVTVLSVAGAATCSSITNSFLTAGSFTSITGVGTLTAGTWNATVVGGTYGGTGVNNGAFTLTLGASFTLNGGGTLSVASGKTATVSNTITLTAGADGQTFALPSTSKTLLANDFTNIGSSTLGLANGGTNADLSASGGSHQVLTQNSVGAAIGARQLACADLSDASSNCSTGTGFKTMFFGSSLLTNTNNAAVRYIGLGLSATESAVVMPISYAGTVKNLHVIISALCCGAGAQYVFTVRQGVSGGAPNDTTLTCTISTGSTVTCADTTSGHAFAVAANDTLELSMTPTAAPTAVAITGWTVEIDPT